MTILLIIAFSNLQNATRDVYINFSSILDGRQLTQECSESDKCDVFIEYIADVFAIAFVPLKDGLAHLLFNQTGDLISKYIIPVRGCSLFSVFKHNDTIYSLCKNIETKLFCTFEISIHKSLKFSFAFMLNDIRLSECGNFSTNFLQVKQNNLVIIFGFGYILYGLWCTGIMQKKLALITLNDNVPFDLQRDYRYTGLKYLSHHQENVIFVHCSNGIVYIYDLSIMKWFPAPPSNGTYFMENVTTNLVGLLSFPFLNQVRHSNQSLTSVSHSIQSLTSADGQATNLSHPLPQQPISHIC